MPKWGLWGWVQFCLNCIIVCFGFGIASCLGLSSIGTGSQGGFVFIGIGLSLMSLGGSLIITQFNSEKSSEIKSRLIEMKKQLDRIEKK